MNESLTTFVKNIYDGQQQASEVIDQKRLGRKKKKAEWDLQPSERIIEKKYIRLNSWTIKQQICRYSVIAKFSYPSSQD